MMGCYKFTLPVPPNRANFTGGHWQRHRDKKKYYDACTGAILMAKSEMKRSGVKLPLQHIEWYAQFEVNQYYDADNLAALCKWPIDLIQDCGILINDSWEHSRPSSWPTQTKVPARKIREMTLEIRWDE